MPHTIRTSRALAALALAAVAIAQAGCVVAIGNRGDGKRPETHEKVRLTDTEQDRAKVIRSKADVPSFTSAENDRVAKLSPATTVEQFKRLFPEAVFRESADTPAGAVQVFEFRDRRVYQYESSRYGYVHDQPVYFRFVDGTLAGWYTDMDEGDIAGLVAHDDG